MRVFSKYHGTNVLKDWERLIIFEQYLKHIPGICTPQPLYINKEKQTIDYNWMHNLKPSFGEIQRQPNTTAIIAKKLALFHQISAKNPNTVNCHPLSSFNLSVSEITKLTEILPTGFFIGDAWHGNMFFDESMQLVFLDPIPNFYLFDSEYRYANGALDLATFHMSLFICHPILKTPYFRLATLTTMAHGFLDAYLAQFNAMSIKKTIIKISKALALRHIKSYSNRLHWPIYNTKKIVSTKVMNKAYGDI